MRGVKTVLASIAADGSRAPDAAAAATAALGGGGGSAGWLRHNQTAESAECAPPTTQTLGAALPASLRCIGDDRITFV